MKVPLLDLKAQYSTIRSEIHAAIERVVESQHFILGPEVEGLEREIAALCKARFAIGVSSGFPDRDRLRSFLRDRGVETEVYYPIPLHLQECFRDLRYRAGDFPKAEAAAHESLALPIYPEITEEQQRYVVDKIREFYR